MTHSVLKNYNRPESFFSLWPVFCLGTQDYMSPLYLANLLIFFLLIKALASSGIKKIFFSLFFITGSVCANYFLVIGFLDWALGKFQTVQVIRWVYLTLATAGFLYGFFHFGLWVLIKKQSDFLQRVGRYSLLQWKGFYLGWPGVLASGLLFLVFGFAATACGSLLANDYAVFIDIVTNIGENKGPVYAKIFLYCATFVLPYVLLCIIMMQFLPVKEMKDRSFSVVILAAVFIAAALGVFKVFLF